MNIESTTRPPAAGQPPRLAMALAVALLVASLVSVLVQHLGLCGRCTMHAGPWAWVGPLGVLGYAALVAAGVLDRYRIFSAGSGVAAGVHTVLVAVLWTERRACLLCLIAAILAASLFLVMLTRSKLPAKFVLGAYMPTMILASGVAAWMIAHEKAIEVERRSIVAAIQRSGSQVETPKTLVIQVFEQDHCGYCRDFREFYLPKLERDLGNRIAVRFLPAAATPWVRRTPTILVEGGPVFEGLPRDYADFRSAVEQALEARKRIFP